MDGQANVLQTAHSTQVVLPLRADTPRFDRRIGDSPLASLASSPLSGRFCAWHGASDQRYVASVYVVDHGAADAGLPDFEAFILIAVVRGPMGRRILEVATLERAGDRRGALALGLARGADEWHVHFLAEDRSARAAMVADLRARHCGDAAEARCA